MKKLRRYTKLPLTDQFLWDVYDFLSTAHDVVDKFDPYHHSILNLIAPNTPLAKKYSRQQFSKFISYLKKKHYISIKNLKKKEGLLITKKGIERVLVASAHPDNRLKRKDGKWLMVIFDVPEKQRRLRDLLRSILTNLGFEKFQQSVWITPYDVLEIAEKLISMHALDDYVKIFVIEEIN